MYCCSIDASVCEPLFCKKKYIKIPPVNLSRVFCCSLETTALICYSGGVMMRLCMIIRVTHSNCCNIAFRWPVRLKFISGTLRATNSVLSQKTNWAVHFSTKNLLKSCNIVDLSVSRITMHTTYLHTCIIYEYIHQSISLVTSTFFSGGYVTFIYTTDSDRFFICHKTCYLSTRLLSAKPLLSLYFLTDIHNCIGKTDFSALTRLVMIFNHIFENIVATAKKTFIHHKNSPMVSYGERMK